MYDKYNEVKKVDKYLRKMKEQVKLGLKDSFYITVMEFLNHLLGKVTLIGTQEEKELFKDNFYIIEDSIRVDDAIAILDMVDISCIQFEKYLIEEESL